VGAGGYAATLVSAYADVKTKDLVNGEDFETENRNKLSIGDKAGNDLQRFDFGLTGLLGYHMRNGWFVRAGVDAGLYDIIRSDNVSKYQTSLPSTVNNMDASSKNLTYTFGVGYMLR
jgi:hypothetical protein